MGGWKKHALTVYLVSWDDQGIVKVGTTCRQRWRKFTLRGARLVSSWVLEDAYDLELAAHIAIFRRWKRAFPDAASAEPFLGHGGGGWMECYSMPAHDAVALVTEMHAHMHPHDARAMRMHGARTDGRTNGQKKRMQTVEKLTARNALRAGAKTDD